MGKFWTKEEDEAVQQGKEEGMTAREIIESFPCLSNRSESSIRSRRLRQLGGEPVFWTKEQLDAIEEAIWRKTYPSYEELIRDYPVLKKRSRGSVERKARHIRAEIKKIGKKGGTFKACNEPIPNGFGRDSNTGDYCSLTCQASGAKSDLGKRYCVGCKKLLILEKGEEHHSFRYRIRCIPCHQTYLEENVKSEMLKK